MTIMPAPASSGIVFNNRVRATIDNAQVEENRVVLKRNGERVALVEHFLAACYALGITDLRVVVEGKELPFFDGSSKVFARMLSSAGPVNNDGRRDFYLSRTLVLTAAQSFLILFPSPQLRINCLIDCYPTGTQFFSTRITPEIFSREIAPARTFGRAVKRRLSQLQRIVGFKIKNINGWLFPAYQRLEAEQCRHKTLDILGDLALLGFYLRAEIFAYNPSHRLNLRLVRQIRSKLDR